MVREAFAGRMAAASGGQGGGQPNPVELIRALRGGRGGRSDADVKSEEAKMTITVDNRSNSLIVTAPEPLFEQVEEMVALIDQGSPDLDESISIVSLRRKVQSRTVQRAWPPSWAPPVHTVQHESRVRPASDKVPTRHALRRSDVKVAVGRRSCDADRAWAACGWHGWYAGRHGRNGWRRGGMGGREDGEAACRVAWAALGGQRGGMVATRGGTGGARGGTQQGGRAGGTAAAADRKRPG